MAAKVASQKASGAQPAQSKTLASELSVLGSSGYLTVRTEKASSPSAKPEKQRVAKKG